MSDTTVRRMTLLAWGGMVVNFHGPLGRRLVRRYLQERLARA